MITPADSPPARPGDMPESSWDIQAPYSPGAPDPVDTGGDDDPGGRDAVAGDVAGAVLAAMGRRDELASDTYGQGSTIGDILTLPPQNFSDPNEHEPEDGSQ